MAKQTQIDEGLTYKQLVKRLYETNLTMISWLQHLVNEHDDCPKRLVASSMIESLESDNKLLLEYLASG